MIRSVDPRLPPEVLFLLWAMGHGDEVAVVDSCYVIDQDGDAVPGTVVRMGDVDILQAMRAILSAVQLDNYFVADPVRQIEHADSEPLCAVRRAVQHEVDDAVGLPCAIVGVAHPEFREQVKNCYGVIITGDVRKQGNFILRKGLDVTPDSILSMGGSAADDDVREQARSASRRGAYPYRSTLLAAVGPRRRRGCARHLWGRRSVEMAGSGNGAGAEHRVHAGASR
jgi:L-fucose mutarotase